MSDSQPSVPYGYCHCGCGEKTRLAYRTNARYDWVKGKPMRFRQGHWSRTQPRSPLAERFWPKVDKRSPDECWGWTAHRDAKGYGSFGIASGHMIRAHRQAYLLEHGVIPPGMHVLHHCDNPACCNPGHLYLGTNADNVADKVVRGRTTKGRRYYRKLSETDVVEIRRLAVAGGIHREIAERFGVDRTRVGQLLRDAR